MVKQKTAFVIGGSGGIGGAVTARLRSDGMRVFSTYHRHQPSSEDSSAHAMDVGNAVSVEEVLHKILEECGQIDVVVYAVSVSLQHIPLLDLQWEMVEMHMIAQCKGFFHVLQGLHAQIVAKKRTKFIVLLSEVCMGKPPSRLAHYTAAKYALLGFSKTAAVELGRFGCTVNMVSPGIVSTELIKSFPTKAVEIATAENPLARIATPEDVAGTISFLASDQADYLNGTNMLVNGGSAMV